MTGMVPRIAEVVGVERESPEVVTVDVAVDGYNYRAGQFNMLYVLGVGEAAISVSSDPEGDRICHTIRAVGNVTRHLCRAQIGDTLGLRGPFGTPWPEPKSDHIVLIAGGIGLAPLRPVMYGLLRHRRDNQRITLLYGARSPEELLFQSELAAWGGVSGIDVEITVDQASLGWTGRVGVVTSVIDGMVIHPTETMVLMCGPEVMMRFAVRALARKGVSTNQVFVSMERNMTCAVAVCGHCQFGPDFVCREGPVFRFDRIETRFSVSEL